MFQWAGRFGHLHEHQWTSVLKHGNGVARIERRETNWELFSGLLTVLVALVGNDVAAAFTICVLLTVRPPSVRRKRPGSFAAVAGQLFCCLFCCLWANIRASGSRGASLTRDIKKIVLTDESNE